MTTEQLTGLQLAVKLIAQIGNDDSDRAIAAVHDLAEAHAQRLTLQHHAADQVWRIADLEVKCNELIDQRDRGDAQNDLLLAELRQVNTERYALRVKVSDLERAAVKRREISDGVEAELVDECDTLRTLKSKAESERDELRARLAEIEAQEPVAFTLQFAGSQRINTETTYRTQRLADEYADGCAECGSDARPIVTPLYASPVPAQAVPTGERQAVLLTDGQIEDGREQVFSTGNPFCPCDAKTMRKAARWAERAVLAANKLEVRRG